MSNRPLALRGHVTNASFKQWVGILLMPKIDRAHKNYLTPEIWKEMHLREIFYGTLIFQGSSIILFVLATMLEGILLPSNMAPCTTFCLHYLVKHSIVTLRCAVNITTSSFQHFLWSLSAKFVFRKRLFINLKATVWSRDQLRITNGAGFKNQITIILFKIWPAGSFSYNIIQLSFS